MPSPLGQKISTRRRELRMSLDKLAELTDTSKSYLWTLENRENPNPSFEKVKKIALALSLTPESLLEVTQTNPQADLDKVFFRKYQELDDSDKVKVRKIVDSWWE